MLRRDGVSRIFSLQQLQRLHVEQSLQCVANIMIGDFKMCPELDPRLAELVGRCIRFEPDERPTAAQAVGILDDVLGGTALTPAPVPSQPSPETNAPRRRRMWIAGAAVILVTAASAAGLLSQPGDAALPADLPPARLSPGPGKAPTMASATYAKANRDTEPVPSELDNPEGRASLPSKTRPKSEAPPAKPRRGSPPRKRKPAAHAEPPMNPKPIPEAAPDRCQAKVAKATTAAETRRWGHVLSLTRNTECWNQGAKNARVKLRTEAFFATERYAECAKAGRGSTDPDVVRWVYICKAKSGGSTP